MTTENPRSTASLGGHPLHVMLVPVPATCFVGALVTDLAYWKTADMLWTNMSAWLLTAGLIVGALAAIAGVIDFLAERRISALRAAWVHAIGNSVVMVLAIFNALIHSRDAYTSVVPTGLILSSLTVLILMVTGWNGWSLVHRHGVGVRGERA